MPDGDLAKRIGRPIGTVRDKRLKRRIPYTRPRYVWWTPREIDLLKSASDEEVARITRRAITAVRQKRSKLGL
jgi:hypothetical protein